jgi:nucleoside-diphosphate-sugar epimerase
MRVFIFGLGYSARAWIASRPDVEASGTTRSQERAAAMRARGVDAFVFSETESAGEIPDRLLNADFVVVSAPPTALGDPAIRRFGDVLRAAPKLKCVIYLSTIGVYGDAAGAWIDEDAPLVATSERGRERIVAERDWLDLSRRSNWRVRILRLGGIYGLGRNMIEKLRAGDARRIVKPGQVFNRIHVDDIAEAISLAARFEGASGAWNIVDDEPTPPQDVTAHAANLIGVPAPEEEPFDAAALSPMARSFYADNKRVSNAKAKRDLGFAPLYPTYREGLAALARAERAGASRA